MHLWETKPVGVGWNATDQEVQDYTGQQPGWAYHQSFKRDLVGEGVVLLSDWEEPGNTVILGSNAEKAQICPRGIWESFPKKVTQIIAQLKCLYIVACSLGNKQELETVV